MKKVVSIALFGASGRYVQYAQYLPAFVLAHLNLFPREEGWVLRVHTEGTGEPLVLATGDAIAETPFVASVVDMIQRDDLVGIPYATFLWQLAKAGLIEVRPMGAAILTRAMLWRVAPVFDADVSYVFCRDIDACPMPRDRAVCEEFMRSDCVLHTVHDNVMHIGMMGGLCGFNAVAFREIWDLPSNIDALYSIAAQTDAQWARHGTDQDVLNRIMLQPRGPRLFEHRFAGWTAGAPGEGKRAAGRYPCSGTSALIPDVGVSRFSGELAARADRLANHLGAAGFDHRAALNFYLEHGDQTIAATFKELWKG